MNLLTKLGAAATALIAMGTVMTWVGGQLAWSGDIRRLDRQQAETAVEVYSKALRDGVVLRQAVKDDPTARAFVDYEIGDVKSKLQQSRDRLIQLSK
jgi:hypothetical protein